MRTRQTCLSTLFAMMTSPALAGGLPPNDDCAAPIQVFLGTPVAFDTTLATTDGGPALDCFFNNDEIGKDVWFWFAAPAGPLATEFRVSLCGSSYDTRLAVYDGCSCGALAAPIACDDDFCEPGLQSEVDFVATPAHCYLIRVGGYVSSGGTIFSGEGVLNISLAPPPPVNDLCVDAIPVAVPSITSGDTTDSTEDEEFTGCDFGFITDVGVWYSVTGTGTGMRATTCGNGTDPDFDTKLTVFCGGCEQDICVDGNNDYNCTPPPPIERQSRVAWCSREGEAYLILVHGTLGEFGVFDLEVTENGFPCSFPAPCAFPENDDCADAVDVTDGITPYDTRLATTDGPEHLLCSLNNPQVDQDLWYRYTATGTGLATFSLCDSGFDNVLALYDGFGCDDLPGHLLNCSDDEDCNGNGPDINDRYARLTIPVACGFDYLLRIGGYSGAAGGGNLEITLAGTPCPVECPEDCADGDGVVGFTDLVRILSDWGGASSCDLDGNGTADFGDVVRVLSAWGVCSL